MTRSPAPTVGITIPGGAAPEHQVPVATEEEPELVDLASLFGDLVVAGMAAHHINDERIQRTEFLYLRRACWEGALIAYGRCFGSGKGATGGSRRRLDDFLPLLPEHLRGSHKQILLLRDKRIGHHVAPWSGQQVELFVGTGVAGRSGSPRQKLIVHVETELYDTDLLADLMEITTLLREKVGQRIDELRLGLLNRVGSIS